MRRGTARSRWSGRSWGGASCGRGDGMPIVDSHTHVATSWYEPIETLLYEMDRNGVDQAALIQMRGQTDNSYQAECVRRYPGRFASVGIVDAQRPDAERALERLAEEGASGVRFHLPLRSPGED